MTFEHVKTEWQPSVVDKILDLDGQIANHLVDARRGGGVRRRAPAGLQGDRAHRPRLLHGARAHRAREGGRGVPPAEARARRDRLRRPDRARACRSRPSTPRSVGEYRDRFAAVLLDEYQDTNVAQAKLMRAMFSGGHPVTAVGDPDQNIYAWRGASLSNLFDFPTDFPKRRRLARRAAAAVHELPVGGSHPARGRHDHLAAARRPAPRPRQAARALRAQRRGRGHGHLAPRRADRGPRDRRSHRGPRSCDGAQAAEGVAPRDGPRSRCSAAPRGCSSCCSRRSPSARSPPRSSGSPACCARPRSSRSWRTRARPTTPWRAWRSPASCWAPATGSASRTSRSSPRWAKGKNYAWRDEGGDDEETPFLFAEALEQLDEVEGLSDEGRARLEEFRAELSVLRGRGAPAGAASSSAR